MAKAPDAPVKHKIDPQTYVDNLDRDRLLNVPGAQGSDWQVVDGILYIATVTTSGAPKLVKVSL